MGRSIYFSDDELIEIETALEGVASSITGEDDLANVDSAFFKVGLALNRPWALKKRAESKSK